MSLITQTRHAELVSASMDCIFDKRCVIGGICPWTLKQVQGDEVGDMV